MITHSTPNLLALHTVRLLGFANTAEIADRADLNLDTASTLLQNAEGEGWIQHVSFADLAGWSLTETGKTENERQLAAERERADPAGAIAAVYQDFLPLNARLLRAVTAWQIRPTPEDRFAPNDHTNQRWDAKVMNELTNLAIDLAPLNEQLSATLARFNGYVSRFTAALTKARNGEPDWIDKTNIDSCHRVWFQLHEDLIATLNIDRRNEHPNTQ